MEEDLERLLAPDPDDDAFLADYKAGWREAFARYDRDRAEELRRAKMWFRDPEGLKTIAIVCLIAGVIALLVACTRHNAEVCEEAERLEAAGEDYAMAKDLCTFTTVGPTYAPGSNACVVVIVVQ